MRRFCLTLILLVTAMGVGTLHAQETVDPTLIDSLATAFENTLASSSLHLVSTTTIESSEAPEETEGNNPQTSQDIQVVRSGDQWNAIGTRTTTTQQPNQSVALTTEFMVVDGVVYLRFPDAPAEMGLPQDWVDGSQVGQQPGIGAFAAGDLSSNLLGSLAYPINMESVTAVSELPADTIEGQAMRVYQLTFNPQVIGSEAVGLPNIGFSFGGGNFQGGPPPFAQGTPPVLPEGAPSGQLPFAQGTPPGLPEGTPPADLQPPSLENIEITIAAYIGEDDGLVHRIISVVAPGEAQPFPMGTTTILTDVSEFNSPVEIIAPEIAS